MTLLDDSSLRLHGAGAKARWSIQVDKEYHKFSAAHFLIFADGTAERLHGHNYDVAVAVSAANDSHGMVVDFKELKPRITAILARLDERTLIPGAHPVLTCEATDDDAYEIRYGRRRYVLPRDDVVVLPVSNTSVENLAHWIAENLLASIRTHLPQLALRSLEVSVEETAGQRGIVSLEP